MFYFERFIISFLGSFKDFYQRKYIIGENHFIRNRKIGFKEIVLYILTNKGRTNSVEVFDYYTKILKNDFETISPQAIGKQRTYICPKIFIDLYESFIDGLYTKFKCFSTFKGYMVLACDGSIFDLPNTKLVRNEFEISEHKLFEHNTTRARVSCMLDVNSGFIITSKLVKRSIDEKTLALQHLENLKSRFNIKKVITIYDRGYNSIELMAKTEDLGSKYLIRLKNSTFKQKIKNMKSDDGIIQINLTNAILNRIRDENLRKKLEKQRRLSIRIVKVKLKTGDIEILATNLTNEEFSVEELKELYGQRWTIETGYDKLKNLIQIEEFTGIRKIIIEQDFYASIFIYNLCTAFKNDSDKRITRKPRNKQQKMKYQTNFSNLIGIIYSNLYELLVKNASFISKKVRFLIIECSKKLTQENLSKNRKKERKTPDAFNKHPGNKKRTH